MTPARMAHPSAHPAIAGRPASNPRQIERQTWRDDGKNSKEHALRAKGSILVRPADSRQTGPTDILVAGATGGIGSAFCREITARFPGARIVRMARDPADTSAARLMQTQT